MSKAEDVISQQQKLRATRSNWDNLYQEIADRCWPQMADFVTHRTPGEKRSEKIFDSTACLALERGSAAFHYLMVPDHSLWHGLGVGDPELMKYQPMKLWLEQIRDALFAVRSSPTAGFSSQSQECIRTLLGFGTQCMFTEEVIGGGRRGKTGIRYKSIHLSEIDFTENADGMVDAVYRLFEYTARQAVEEWGLESLPAKIREKFEKNDEVSKFQFIHHVSPNRDRDVRRMDYKGKKFYSCYVSVEGKQLVDEGGYRRFPYHISRYATNPREGRGRGPAIVLLPDIKMLNEQEKTRLRAGHLAVDPPLLMFEDGALQAFQMRPRALNFGGVSEDGKPLVVPLQTGANLPWATDLLEERRKLIREGFWLQFFQALLDNPQMTATQAMLLAQQSGQFLASPLGRQQSEWFGPLIRREIDILAEADMLPLPPEDLWAYLPIERDPVSGEGVYEIADELDIEYTSPLAKLIKSEEAIAVLRSIEQLAPLAQIDPRVMRVFHPDRTAQIVTEANGVPAKALRSEAELKALDEQEAQAANAANLLQGADVAASAAKNFAQATATAGNVPGPQAELAAV